MKIVKKPSSGGASAHVIVDSGSLTANAGTNLNTSLLATEATLDTRTGSLTEGAPASDTASSGLNGRLQRIAQRLTSLIALLPASLGQKTMAASLAVTVASDQAAYPVTANAGTNLNTSALALSATQTDRTQKSQVTDGTRDGTVKAASTLPVATDTALVVTQRDALPAGSAVIGHVITDSGSVTNATLAAETTKVIGTVNQGTSPWVTNDPGLPDTLGQKTMANSTGVVIASDQSAVTVDTELPAAAALADGETATPSVPRVGVVPLAIGSAGTLDRLRSTTVGSDAIANVNFGHLLTANLLLGFDGSNWGRVRIDSGNKGLLVNGDVDHDAVNTLKQVQVAGNAQAIDNPPTAVSASGDRVRIWADRFGAVVVRPRQIRETYTAAFRLAETAARLDQTFTQVANTNKQWATLHHTASATKELKLLKCWAYITSDTVAGIQGIIELRELTVTTPPATGNPAITGRPHRIGTGAHEATALYLPGTQGSEAAVNSPLGHVPFDTGISGAVSAANPVPVLVPVVLYDAATEDPSAIPPTAPVAVYGGWAVMIRTVGVPVLRVTIFMRFTEEIP